MNKFVTPTIGRGEYNLRRYLQTEREAKKWIEAVLDKKLNEDFHTAIRSGVILCE